MKKAKMDIYSSLKKLKNRKLYAALLITILSFTGYLLTLPFDYKMNLSKKNHRRLLTTLDAVPNTFLPYTIIEMNTLYFDGILKTLRSFDGTETPYFLVRTDKGLYSKYPILPGLLATPVYALPLLLNKIPTLDYYENILNVLTLGRITASLYTAISIGLFYYLMLLNKENKKLDIWDYIFLIFYAFGTNSFSISSRSLWQHTYVQLFMTLTLIFLTKGLKDPKYIKYSGTTVGLSILSRPTEIIFGIFVALYILVNKREEFKSFILYGIPAAIFFFVHNILIFGGPLSEGYQQASDTQFSTPILTGLVGNLFSPGKSILIISPPLALSFFYLGLILLKKKSEELEHLYKYLGLSFIFFFFMISKWWSWESADRFGYGFFTDYLPLLGILSYHLYLKLSNKGKIFIFVLILYSLYIQINGVLFKKSRCKTKDVWTLECLLPPKRMPEY